MRLAEVRRNHAQNSPAAADERRGLHSPHARFEQHVERGRADKNLALRDVFHRDARDGLQGCAAGG